MAHKQDGTFQDLLLHNAPATRVLLSSDQNFAFTADENGVIMMCDLQFMVEGRVTVRRSPSPYPYIRMTTQLQLPTSSTHRAPKAADTNSSSNGSTRLPELKLGEELRVAIVSATPYCFVLFRVVRTAT